MSDLISRQAAIDEMTDKNITRNMDSVQDSELHRIKRAVHRILASLPSAQPERKKGQWISRDGKEDCYECSECHAVIEGNEVYWRNNYFCYHCGADMRGEDDERPY